MEGRGLSSRPTQDVVRDLEIGQPSNSERVQKLQTALHAKRRDVLSESRMREICMSGSMSGVCVFRGKSATDSGMKSATDSDLISAISI